MGGIVSRSSFTYDSRTKASPVGEVEGSSCTVSSVPAGILHWFDMGPEPNITAIRFFDNQEGWVPNFTGSDVAEKFPKFENAKGPNAT